MSPFTLSGRILAAAFLSFAVTASAVEPNKTNDKGKDDKKDTKSNTDTKSSPSPAPSGPVNKNAVNGTVPNRNMPNAGTNPVVPNAQAPQGVRRLLGGSSGMDRRSQWEWEQMQREQWLRDQQRQQDEQWQRDRDLDAHERALDRASRYENRPISSNEPAPPVDTTLRGTGSVVSAQSGQLVVKIDGDVVRVQRNADSKIEVFGAAEVEALQPGRIVRIEGTFETVGKSQMQATKPILAVDIVTPRPGSVPGTMTPLAGDAAPQKGENLAPEANAVRSLSVIGRVVKCSQGELTLDLAGTTLKGKLDPAATVSLRGSDINLAHAGDQVEVVGYYMKPGYAMGKEIRITLANAFGKPQNDFAKRTAAIPAAAAPAIPAPANPTGK